jgi:hypothetical protein
LARSGRWCAAQAPIVASRTSNHGSAVTRKSVPCPPVWVKTGGGPAVIGRTAPVISSAQ